jgi:hypothetical protein
VKRIFDYPEIPMSIACGIVFAIVVAVGIIVVQRYVRDRLHGPGRGNEVVNTTLTVFSVFYGVLLGMLVVGAFENYKSIANIASKESSAASALYRDVVDFPEPTRGRLMGSLRQWAQEVIDHSFADQARGVRPTGETPMINDIVATLHTFEPRTVGQQNLHADALRDLDQFLDVRHERLSNTHIGLPPVLWWIVGLGAAITLLLICLLDYPLRVHLAFGCLLAFFIGAVIFAIASQENPFSGSNSVGPEELKYLLNLVS